MNLSQPQTNHNHVLEVLEALKTENPRKVAKRFKVSKQTIYYYIRKYRTPDLEGIKNAINNRKQETCEHTQNPKIFFKCTDCGKNLCENHLEELFEILQKMKALQGKKLIEVSL